jgi:hypothetical protein
MSIKRLSEPKAQRMRIILLLTGLIIFLSQPCYSQSASKQLAAKRTTATIKIDGNLDDAAWKDVKPATSFIEYRPTFGKLEDTATRTEVYLLYDNAAVYVGGYCHERTIDSISKELIGRDKIGVNDFVGIFLDTYNNKINGNGFFVTPYGEQYDAKYSNGDNGEDDSWNAVWDSEAKIHQDGWSFEMKIPYSALRFNSIDNQTWGLNIIRKRNKTSQQLFWNSVSPNVNGLMPQEGTWAGIEKIEAPMRLSLSPYFSAYLNHYPFNQPGVKNTTTSINGGMDVKYGINESFTLDMTLIPDFGQVPSDNKILNLSPFEVKYNENRSFFTEGTELFNKGNLFYSRRVGGLPLHYYDVQDSSGSYAHINRGERFIKNPSETKLINATKITGRTKKGLGIGFFNALTQPMFAIVENNNKERRKIQISALTNYNIIVLDQALKNNSSVSFINTNVVRKGLDYNANVSAGLFDFNNKKNTFNWNGKFAVSTLYGNKERSSAGYSHKVGLGKTGGRWNFNITQELADDKYDINDLGILFNNNYLDHSFWTGYKWIKPGKWYNNLQINYNLYYSRRFKESAYQKLRTDINAHAQLKNLWFIGAFGGYSPEGNDFYEPRVSDRFYRSPGHADLDLWMESNQAKKYTFGGDFSGGFYSYFKGKQYSLNIFHNYRFSDKFSVGQELSYRPSYNETGFTDIVGDTIIFARRNRNTVENVLKWKYNFNNKSGITFRARHYWSKVQNQEFFTLNRDGTLLHTNSYGRNADVNYNALTIDAGYTLQFAPGSFIDIVWKNSIYTNNNAVQFKYVRNLDRTISSPQNNNFSIKVLYYLDYLNFRKKK